MHNIEHDLIKELGDAYKDRLKGDALIELSQLAVDEEPLSDTVDEQWIRRLIRMANIVLLIRMDRKTTPHLLLKYILELSPKYAPRALEIFQYIQATNTGPIIESVFENKIRLIARDAMKYMPEYKVRILAERILDVDVVKTYIELSTN